MVIMFLMFILSLSSLVKAMDIWSFTISPQAALAEQLFSAIVNDEAERTYALLLMGAPIEALDRYHSFGRHPLHLAAARGCLPVIKVLLEAGADMHFHSFNLPTPFEIAATNNNLEAIKLFIQSGALKGTGDNGSHALRCAIMADSEQVVEYFYTQNLVDNLPIQYDFLLFAVEKQKIKSVKVLLNRRVALDNALHYLENKFGKDDTDFSLLSIIQENQKNREVYSFFIALKHDPSSYLSSSAGFIDDVRGIVLNYIFSPM